MGLSFGAALAAGRRARPDRPGAGRRRRPVRARRRGLRRAAPVAAHRGRLQRRARLAVRRPRALRRRARRAPAGSANGSRPTCSTAPARAWRSARRAGFAAAALLTRARNAAWCRSELEGFVTIGIVLVIYGVAEAIGAYGLLAVFAAGFTFRRYEFDHEMHRPVHHGAEAAGKALELLVLLMLGTMLTTRRARGPRHRRLAARAAAAARHPPRPRVRHRRPALPGPAAAASSSGSSACAASPRSSTPPWSSRRSVLDAGEQHVVVWTTIACVVVFDRRARAQRHAADAALARQRLARLT